MESREQFYFNDSYRITVKEGYLEYYFRLFKRSCACDLEPYLCIVEKGVLHPFRGEFMDAVDFWGKDILFAIMEKHNVRYGDATKWLKSREEELILRGGLWKEMTREYPVLNRIMDEVATDLKEHICEIVRVLYQHQKEIADYFFRGIQGRVQEIGAGCSDYHSGHKSAHVITYSHGGKLIYKPRSMQTDLAWHTFLQDAASNTCRNFYVPRVLDCGDYGFAEYISRVPADSEEDVREYFERMGFMSGLIYALGGRDIHYENVIAHGACPVIVDTETIAGAGNQVESRLHLEDTCMFPWLLKEKGYYGGHDALTSGEAAGKNLPLYAGECLSARAFAEEVADGFEQAYRLLLHMDITKRKALLSVWEGCTARHILKSTSYYYNVLRLLRTRGHLRSHEAFQEALLQNKECSDSEKDVLYHLQIPLFSKKVNSQDLLMRCSHLCEADLVKRKEDIRRWLDHRTAMSGASCFSKAGMTADSGESISIIERTAISLLEYWNARIKEGLVSGTGGKVLVVERKSLHYYDAGLNCYFLESIPGWILVNLCWEDCMDRSRQNELFILFLNRLKQQIQEVPSAAMERGFLEGVGGLIYVLGSLYRKTRITMAGELCERVLQEVMDSECVKNPWNDSWRYGEQGLLSGLYALPEDMVTERVRLRIKSMEQILKTSGAPAFEDICHPPAITDRLCQNVSLFCGNAGAAYRLAERAHRADRQDLRDRAVKIAAAMSERMEREGTYPLRSKDMRAGSFLYGEGGILYSLKCILDAASLPKIFKDSQ